MKHLLEVEGVRKAFPGVVALDGVSLSVPAGSVHVVMGENGAGKSTLMKIIAGLSRPDAGCITLRGRAAMIHQELHLIPSMTVAENIWIGREPLTRFGFVDDRELARRTGALLAGLGIEVDAGTYVADLSIAERQMVEIARALSHDADVLIMDEPTSALSEREVEQLFRIVHDLKQRGKAIIYITHRINEVFRIADHVTVLRDGRLAGCEPASRLTAEQLIAMMVGRELTQLFPKHHTPCDRVALSVRRLTLEGEFSEVSFDVRAGEILGIAGLVGSKRTELAETIFGVRRATGGEVFIDGVRADIASPRAAIDLGLALLTEDRQLTGLLLPLAVQENMEVTAATRGFARFGFVRQAALAEACSAMTRLLRVKCGSLRDVVTTLSGGNQQKVIVGRWLLSSPRVLLLDEPTRGIDVGAKSEIHALISRLAAEGAAVVMISSEMPEILGMSDRVMVMRGGRVAGVLDGRAATQVAVMTLAACPERSRGTH
jgi:inositol transport system ATP-binding protein